MGKKKGKGKQADRNLTQALNEPWRTIQESRTYNLRSQDQPGDNGTQLIEQPGIVAARQDTGHTGSTSVPAGIVQTSGRSTGHYDRYATTGQADGQGSAAPVINRYGQVASGEQLAEIGSAFEQLNLESDSSSATQPQAQVKLRRVEQQQPQQQQHHHVYPLPRKPCFDLPSQDSQPSQRTGTRQTKHPQAHRPQSTNQSLAHRLAAQARPTLNPSAPSFQGQGGSMLAKPSFWQETRINKFSRYSPPNRKVAAGKAHSWTPINLPARGPEEPADEAVEKLKRHLVTPQVRVNVPPGSAVPTGSTASSLRVRRGGSPKKHVVPRPEPTHDYLNQVTSEPWTLSSPRQLLVILDLNGVLVHRKRGASHTPRPGLGKFLEYIFANHQVMVWSSGMPENVERVCKAIFTADQLRQICAIWSRDTLRLPPWLYREHVQVYKQLSWVWETPSFSAYKWDQTNTVLVDDAREKAAAEPWNLIEVEEFEAKPHQMEQNGLERVRDYLEELKMTGDVSRYIYANPLSVS